MKVLRIGNLTIAVPIIQGGMGVGISLSGLAAAVANEGGVGVISSAGLGLLYKDFSSDYLSCSCRRNDRYQFGYTIFLQKRWQIQG